MWFLVLGIGAVLLHRVHAPEALGRWLSVPPPPEATWALYFLAAALLRLVIRNARLAALQRKARRDARRAQAQAKERPALLDVGAGVGKGVAEVVLGTDIIGAAIATLVALVRLVMRSTRLDPAEMARRTRDRQQKTAREHRRAAACVAGVGALCAALAWAPWWQPRLPSGFAQVAQALPALRDAASRVTRPAGP
jgi:hypothetical protein